MNIVTTDPEFIPTNFVLCQFYGKITCFCWNNNKLVAFPYVTMEYTSNLELITAPRSIKKIQCFSNTVFLICSPCGVYKLAQDMQFNIISKNAIGIGTTFDEVFIPKNNHLYLKNKQTTSKKALFFLSSTLNTPDELCTFTLNSENSEVQLFKALLDAGSERDSLCIIGNGKQLFKLVNESVHLIYSCDNNITDIVPIQNKEKVIGLLLVTNTDSVIIMYSKCDKLQCEKIYLEANVMALCAGVSSPFENKIWIVYSDKSKLHYVSKKYSIDMLERIKTEEISVLCLRYYMPNKCIALLQQKQLCEISIDLVESISNTATSEDDKFIELHSNMVESTNLIMNEICEKVKELDFLNQMLQTKEDMLNRISLYSYKRKMEVYYDMIVHKIANQLFIILHFQDSLPKHVYIACSLICNQEIIFCIKEITDAETIVGIQIPEKYISNLLEINLDLITIINEGCPWFFVKNFLLDVVVKKKSKHKSKKDKTNFLNAKIRVIRNLMDQQNLDIKKLSEIKKSVRNEMGDI